MEGLLAEINKRKASDFEAKEAPSSKYQRRGDAEREREEAAARKREEERQRKADAESSRAAKMRKEAETARNASLEKLAASGANTPDVGSPAPDGASERFNISADECIRRLRAKGQPIRLFGETDKDRRLRLRALEMLEDRPKGEQNDFKRAVEDMNLREQERQARGESSRAGEASAKDDDKRRKRFEDGPLDLGLIKTDFNKLHPLIYWAFKNLLKEWEEWLDARPDDIKRTAQGKLAAANQVQSAQNLKPLFKQLRSRELGEDVVRHLAEIIHYAQVRQYQKANDAYLRLSIGNAAWPIGVTSVGIHERSSREKIQQDNIAHVLNDEVSRKYIQAVKRLLTFSQTVRPPDNISQLMG
ncbi:hypothetical protein Q8F55_006991 [Vanrija albida]|uniref:Pre-mRNA-splicing factor 18 n=1 Tax=Vanrija albida TaxID=181172 RepID=A0ABR3PYK3_9TREE